MSLFTPEELEELRRVDAEIEESFLITNEELRESRKRDKAAVSYNLLWGTGALTILLVACAVLSVKVRLGM